MEVFYIEIMYIFMILILILDLKWFFFRLYMILICLIEKSLKKGKVFIYKMFCGNVYYLNIFIF